MARERTIDGRLLLPGEHALRNLALRTAVALASGQRRRRRQTTFVGITGSLGKTTTKTLVAELLGPRTISTVRNQNRFARVAQTILRTRRSTPFCVVEVAAWEPGSVAELACLVRPRIGVVTCIGLDHYKAFRSREAVAAEKQALIASLPGDGIAVLNADDPHVIAMAAGFPGRVVSFGEASGATFRAENVRSSWPDPLQFTLHAEGRTLPVRTRLHGKQSATSVLAALATAHAAGVPLERAVEGVGRFEAVPGRMSPADAGGVAFVRDDTKASAWAFDPVLEFIGEARAARKLLVVGTVSDYAGSSSKVYTRLAERALAVADEVAFVGPQAHHVRKLVETANGRLRMFATVRAAAEHLESTLTGGDLVVLKGSNRADHLLRILLTRTTGVRCWRESCGRRTYCDACPLLQRPE